MAGKSPKKKYGEFRTMIQYMKRGKYRIRPEFVPSISAYLAMCGKVYQRAIEGMRNRILVDQVPGLEEAIATLEICQTHLARLLSQLPQHFDQTDWVAAVADVCALLQITPDSRPLEEFPEDGLVSLIPGATDGGDTRPG